jgi:predicted metal-dependent peptidase
MGIIGNDDAGRGKVKGLVCHEVLHPALFHLSRSKGYAYPKIANVAQDMVVNSIVKRAGMDLPDGGFIPDHNDSCSFPAVGVKITIGNVSARTWEDVYAEIIEKLREKDKDPGKYGDGGGGHGGWDHHDTEADGELSPEEQEANEQSWRNAINQAAQVAKQQGKLPAGMERYIDDVLKPKVSWRALLLRYMRQYLTPVDWSYSRPHKKSKALGVYLPNVVKESCDIEIICDTSGSIGEGELSRFLGEIVGISKSFQHVKMAVSFVDSAVAARYQIDNATIPQILAMKPAGGGGTSMEAGLDYVNEHNPRVPVVVVFTDGYDSYRKGIRDYPFDVIWCITEGGVSLETARQNIKYGVKLKL